MPRYLLFDSTCEQCTKLAQAIGHETNGWLTTRSLSDCGIQKLLHRTNPAWRWRPTLLEVEGEQLRAFTGFGMGWRLVTGLGPRQAWRVAKLAWESGALSSALNQTSHRSRRRFLQTTAVAAASIFFPLKGAAAQSIDEQVSIVDLPSDAAAPYLETATSSPEYKAFLDKIEQEYAGIFTIDHAKSRASEVQSSKQQDAEQVFVVIPVIGGAGYSGLSLAFNKDGRIVEDMATFAITRPDQNIGVEVIKRGKTAFKAIIAPDGTIVDLKKTDGLQSSSHLPAAGSGSAAFAPTLQSCNCFCCLQGCLASQGVPAWAVTLIGVACALACGSLTPACLLCLLSIVFIASGTYNFCAGRCLNTGCCGYSC